MIRIYRIWPASREGVPAHRRTRRDKEGRWLVLDVTDGLEAAHVVEGPVSRQTALCRLAELRAIARQTAEAADRPVNRAEVP